MLFRIDAADNITIRERVLITRELTEGKPFSLILSFSIPILLGGLFQQSYNMADAAIVGKFIGTEALAAVGSVGNIQFLVFGFALGMCSGFCLPVARYFGAKDMEGVRRCVMNLTFLSLCLSVLLSITMYFMTGTVLRWMNTPENMYQHAYNYLSVLFAGLGITILYNVLAGLSRAMGDSRTPLFFLILSSVLNICLDFLFIVALDLGTTGAGIATLAAQMVSVVCCLIYMLRRFEILKIPRAMRKLEWATMAHLLHMGLPMALQFSITAVGGIILQSQVNPLGSDTVAAMTAAGKVHMILCQPVEAIGATMATFSSQNLGAGRIGRVRSGVKAALTLSVLAWILSFALALTVGPWLARVLFLSNAAPFMMNMVRSYFMAVSGCILILGVLMTLRNTIQGLGFALPAMMAGVLELIARSAVGLLLVRNIGFDGVLIAAPAAWVAACALLIPMYFVAVRRLGGFAKPLRCKSQ